MDDLDIKIGRELKRMRDANNLSLQDVADKIGKSRYTIHGYEKGRNSISASLLMQLCEYYGFSINEVYYNIRNKD